MTLAELKKRVEELSNQYPPETPIYCHDFYDPGYYPVDTIEMMVEEGKIYIQNDEKDTSPR